MAAGSYSTLRMGLYNALATPLMGAGGVSPQQDKELKKIANTQADAIISFLTTGVKHWTITEFKGAVELNSLTNNPIDADLKITYTFDMIAIMFMLIKMLFEPMKKIGITKPIYSAIMGIISKLEQALGALIPVNPGAGEVGVPVELDKSSTSLVAHGHCYVGPPAAAIGDDGATLANPLGAHTKVKLWPMNIKPKELVAMPTAAPKAKITT